MNSRAWPERDQRWVARYRMSMAGKHVPEQELNEREGELLDAVRRAEVSAEELFGDAGELATEDATELATADEAVRTSLGGGLRPALREVGGTLLGAGVVAVLLLLFRGGWSVDIDIALSLVAGSVLLVFVSWVVSRALFTAGRSAAGVTVMVVAGGTAVAGIATAADLGAGQVAASDVPVPLLALGIIAPGVATLLAANWLPQKELRNEWTDAEWLRRFRGSLRAHLMPAAATHGHVAEIQQALTPGAASAYAEFGHPLTLARVVAAADSVSRARRWWVTTVVGVGVPLGIALVVFTNQSWGALSVPGAVALVLVAGAKLVASWSGRPFTERQSVGRR